MSIQKYREFIDELCKVIDVEDPSLLYENCHVMLDGVPFTIAHGDPELDSDSIYIYCDFGAPPEEVKGLVLQRLMETNLVMFGNGTPMFGFNGDTGNILLMQRMVLSQMEFDSLMYVMEAFVGHIEKWRPLLFAAEPFAEQLPMMQLAAAAR